MARQTQSKTFNTSEGALEISVLQLGGMQGGKLAVRLGKILAPAAAKGTGVKDGDVDAIGSAVTILSDRLSPEEFESVLLQLLHGATVIGPKGSPQLTPALLDDLFAGRFEELLRLAQFALEVNFKSFYNALGTLFGTALLARAKTVSSGPPSV